MVVYRAKLTQEDGAWLVELPDCPGCQTQGDTREEALAAAQEALDGWLESHLNPPKPQRKTGASIQLGPTLAAAVQAQWAREAGTPLQSN